MNLLIELQGPSTILVRENGGVAWMCNLKEEYLEVYGTECTIENGLIIGRSVGGSIFFIHIRTKEEVKTVENVLCAAVDGPHLLFTTSTSSCLYNTATGENTALPFHCKNLLIKGEIVAGTDGVNVYSYSVATKSHLKIRMKSLLNASLFSLSHTPDFEREIMAVSSEQGNIYVISPHEKKILKSLKPLDLSLKIIVPMPADALLLLVNQKNEVIFLNYSLPRVTKRTPLKMGSPVRALEARNGRVVFHCSEGFLTVFNIHTLEETKTWSLISSTISFFTIRSNPSSERRKENISNNIPSTKASTAREKEADPASSLSLSHTLESLKDFIYTSQSEVRRELFILKKKVQKIEDALLNRRL